jgi:hypothetical protein
VSHGLRLILVEATAPKGKDGEAVRYKVECEMLDLSGGTTSLSRIMTICQQIAPATATSSSRGESDVVDPAWLRSALRRSKERKS